MNRLIFFILSMVLAGSAGSVFGGSSWNCRTWDVDSGLLDSSVMDVKQSSDGFLWVATSRGLMCFDGNKFRSRSLNIDISSVGKKFGLFIDSLDRIWLAKRNGDIFCQDNSGSVLKIPYDEDQKNPGYVSIVEDKEGKVYFCYQNGGFFSVRDGKVEPIKADGMPDGNTRKVVKDGFGQVWFSNGMYGLGIIKDGGLLLKEPLPVDNIVGSHSGGLWICSGNQLFRYREGRSVERICELPQELTDINQNSLLEDRCGCVWFGSLTSGLFCYDGNDFAKVASPDRNITSIFEDAAGNIWVGTSKGLSQLTPAVARLVPSGEDNNNNVYSVCEGTNNVLWIIWNTGLVSKGPGDNLFPAASLEKWSVVDSNALPMTQCAVADPAGGVWFGTVNSGVYCLQNGVVTTNLTTQNGLAAENVNSLHLADDGVLWIGSKSNYSNSVFVQSWRSGVYRTHDLPSDCQDITAIATDSNSNCWFSSYGGYLFRVDPAGMLVDETASLPKRWRIILSLCPTPDGSLWIGFSEQGLGRLKKGRFFSYKEEQGLCSIFSSRIQYDGISRLWFSGSRGVFSVSLGDFDALDEGISSTVQSVYYGRNEGMTSARPHAFIWPGAIRDSSGRILFGMHGGLTVIKPAKSGDVELQPPVIIERVTVDGRIVADYWTGIDVSSGSIQLPPLNLRQNGKARLRIPPGSRHLDFTFTALSFKMPESTMFKCRMNGLNDGWRDIGSQRTVSYYDMPPGDYDFQVIARNSDGVWNETGASLALTIEPYWWEIAWFRVGGPLAAVGLLLFGIIIFLRNRQKLQIERLEMQKATEKERARIAADLHDDFGAGLTEISLTGELALDPELPADLLRGYLAEIVARTIGMAESLDQIVWAVNPANDMVTSLVEYSIRFFERIVGKTSMRMRLAVDRVFPEVFLGTGVRYQLFLAFREAVTNVIRHSGADEVHLTIEVRDNIFVMAIQDNGRGMDLSAENPDGNGLRNMKYRLEKIGGESRIITEPGKGTTVRFEVGLKL